MEYCKFCQDCFHIDYFARCNFCDECFYVPDDMICDGCIDDYFEDTDEPEITRVDGDYYCNSLCYDAYVANDRQPK